MNLCKIKRMGGRLKRFLCMTLSLSVLFCTVSVAFAGTSAHAADSESELTPLSIAEGLGNARYFGIVANTLSNPNNLNVEANLAVQNFTGSYGEVGNTHNWSQDTGSSAGSAVLNLTVPKGNYEFCVYQDEAAKTAVGQPFWVESTQKETVQKTITGLKPGQTYYVYLLQNGTANTKVGTKFQVAAGSDSEKYANINYIEDFDVTNGTTLKVKDISQSLPGKVYFGSQVQLNGPDNPGGNKGSAVDKKSKCFLAIDQLSAVTNEKFPVELGTENGSFAKKTFDQLNSLSQKLSKVSDSSKDAAVKVLNITPESSWRWDGSETVSAEQVHQDFNEVLNYSNWNDLANDGVSLENSQYLVINLHLPAGCSSVELPQVTIGGINAGSGYNAIARRILWNFCTDSGSLSGNLQILSSPQAGVLGTLLAPEAKITLQDCAVTGAVYANTVTVQCGGGLKCATFQAGSTAEAAVTVPDPTVQVTFNKTAKMLSDGRTAQITLSRSGRIQNYTSQRDAEVIMMMDRSTSMKLSVDGKKHANDTNLLDDVGNPDYKIFAKDSRLALLQGATQNFLTKLTECNSKLSQNKQIPVSVGTFCWSKDAINGDSNYYKDDPMNTADYNLIHNSDGTRNKDYAKYTPKGTAFQGTFLNAFTTPVSAAAQVSKIYPAPYTCLDAAIDLVAETVQAHANDGKRKFVIFISDGEPNGPNVKNASAAAQRMKEKGLSDRSDTSIYSAFIGSSEEGEATMKALASQPENYLLVQDEDGLNNVFQKLEEGVLSYAFDNSTTVTDTLPNYLMLTDAQQKAIEQQGGTVQVDSKGQTTITWKNLSLSQASQDITFEATAKSDYFASPDGQTVPTNVSASLTYTDPVTKNVQTKTTDSPQVTISGTAALTGGEQTIARGEKVDLTSLSAFKNSNKAVYGTGDVAGFTTTPGTLTGFTWEILDTDKKTVLATSENGKKWKNKKGKQVQVSPTETTTYYLRVYNKNLYKNAKSCVVEKDFDQTVPLKIMVPCTGSITIQKTLKEGKGSLQKAFTVQVRCAENGYAVDLPLTAGTIGGLQLSHLQPGTYTIHEVVPQDYRFVSAQGADAVQGSADTYQVTISAKSLEHTVTITNQYQPPSYYHGSDSVSNLFQTDSSLTQAS
ncbi:MULTISPECIES: VWA domain-containing protein [Caproicibacterium]|uniref:VWA domain-containing protein n=1 Tax=Caproicibacterium argilliputei TaxID=3030016 RepID=A0AA97DAY9_9FIRM|nr:VWA domain-containing protein [Caproicibacterium argilliputei]WOC33514.1 VWA domain-containing protein [Caproicibacterium argilliputei]